MAQLCVLYVTLCGCIYGIYEPKAGPYRAFYIWGGKLAAGGS